MIYCKKTEEANEVFMQEHGTETPLDIVRTLKNDAGVEGLLLGNIQDLRFMDRRDFIDFAINAKTLRDGLSDYYDITLSSFLKNPLITRYLEVIDELDFLIDDIRDEVAEQSEQFGERERKDNGWIDVSLKAVAARKKAEKTRQKKRKRKYTRKQGG